MKIPKQYRHGKILPIVQAGNPALTGMVTSLSEDSIFRNKAKFRKLALNMMATSYHYAGAGLAAPQVGHNIRMFVLTVHPSRRYPQAPDYPDTVVIQPTIKEVSNELSVVVEGCLSIPGFYAAIQRPQYISVDYYTLDLKTGSCEFTTHTLRGFVARVFQHEYDHVEGRLFPSRVTNWEFCATEANRNELRERVERAEPGSFDFSLI